jgi:hypothetical protein
MKSGLPGSDSVAVLPRCKLKSISIYGVYIGEFLHILVHKLL